MIRQDLTYRDLDSSIDNLWSILFTTGYLTQRGKMEGETAELVIPNREIRWIFVRQIYEWFAEETVRDSGRLENFCRAFWKNDVTAIEDPGHEYEKRDERELLSWHSAWAFWTHGGLDCYVKCRDRRRLW